MDDINSEVRFVKLPKTRVARYVVISPYPENDVINYMDNWAKASGLLSISGYTPRKFGWDFPFVTKEQREKFGLRGYVYCYTVPENFEPEFRPVEIVYIEADEYAVLRIKEPFSGPFEVPNGWKRLHEYVVNSEFAPGGHENRYWMEEIISDGSKTYMDIYYPVR